MADFEIIVIGSGIGGLVAGSLLARYGKRVLTCESHSVPGGAAHGFQRQGFHFDTGPSFYCGLSDPQSLNPVRQVLQALGETVDAIAYDPLGYYHFPADDPAGQLQAGFPIYGDAQKYREAVAQITPDGAHQLQQLEQKFLALFAPLQQIPLLTLRSNWTLIPWLLRHQPMALAQLLPQLRNIQSSAGAILNRTVRDPWVRRLFDLECFLLSGLPAQDTVAPEMAFMFGERSRSTIDYPLGGSPAIVNALVRGLTRWGGQLRLKTHVDRIIVNAGKVQGIQLKNGDQITAPVVISNATLWDTYTQLLQPEDLPATYRQKSLSTPAVDSFMHLHLGIRTEGLRPLPGHHVVIHSNQQPITHPGNTCMISIPSVWDESLAPEGHHVVHAYTLEPFAHWEHCEDYEGLKQERVQPLYRAVETVIPDLRSRITLELIGTPLTHRRFLRRFQGSYGPAIAAGKGTFPSCHTPISGLYRVGDSTLPGIGVPAVAASGILCANTLVSPQQIQELLQTVAET
ncbi:NAD(P)/FAD-dependent oxidoreductase [Acaryochloris sp. IP29b_bin.148]|uniref:phytoene desaturase family protein n=1 Tax=Acaryochloris sp. IP29b_bin.148 TaxID=2969218 RepID=UPI002617F157|nr:NAD(P)/FAD-dependent oxidoreductase [Acaryochloris sp. IP29b_bin.148]